MGSHRTMDWMPLVYLAGIVLFWVIVFFAALYMTRRSLSGVGELVLDDVAGHAPPSPNGHNSAAEPPRTQVAASNNGSAEKA